MTHTCLAITHQTQLLGYADVVYRLDGGRVTAEEAGRDGRASRRASLSGLRRLAR